MDFDCDQGITCPVALPKRSAACELRANKLQKLLGFTIASLFYSNKLEKPSGGRFSSATKCPQSSCNGVTLGCVTPLNCLLLVILIDNGNTRVFSWLQSAVGVHGPLGR